MTNVQHCILAAVSHALIAVAVGLVVGPLVVAQLALLAIAQQ